MDTTKLRQAGAATSSPTTARCCSPCCEPICAPSSRMQPSSSETGAMLANRDSARRSDWYPDTALRHKRYVRPDGSIPGQKMLGVDDLVLRGGDRVSFP